MMDVFLQILDMAVSGTFVILAVFLVRGAMRGFPKKYVYALWLIVGLRLVCPVSVTSPVSLFNLDFVEQSHAFLSEQWQNNGEQKTEMAGAGGEKLNVGKTDTTDKADVRDAMENMSDGNTEKTELASTGTADVTGDENIPETIESVSRADVAGADITEEMERGATTADNHEEMESDGSIGASTVRESEEGNTGINTDVLSLPYEPSVATLNILSIIWLVGMVMLIIWNIVLTVGLRKRLEKAVLFRDNIYESDVISSPFVMGVFSPRIYIPFRLPDREREYILRHEQHHIHRQDHIIKMIAFFITTVYWFHPLVWMAWFCMVKDMEMSCDEYVLSKMEEDVREDYSRSLLAFAANKRRFFLGTLSFGETNTENRVKHVLTYRKKGRWLIVPAILIFALLGTSCLTNGESGKDARLSAEHTEKAGETGENKADAEEPAESSITENMNMDGGGSVEQNLWQAIRKTMPQVVVEQLEKGEHRIVQNENNKTSYCFRDDKEDPIPTKKHYATETLHLDFIYRNNVLKRYVIENAFFLYSLSSKVSEVWHDPQRTEQDLEKRAKQLLRQFDKEFLGRDGTSGYYQIETPKRFGDGNEYMCFKDDTYGDSYVVCLMYDMVFEYVAAKKADSGKGDDVIRIAYKDPDTPNQQWEYYTPIHDEQKMLKAFIGHLDLYEGEKEQEYMREDLSKEQERGIALYYKGEYWSVYTGGYLAKDSGDGKVIYSAKLNLFARMCLGRDQGYQWTELKEIYNITAATLVYSPADNPETDGMEMRITDTAQLAQMEQAFSKGKYIRGGSDCPFGEVTLLLKRERGSDITLTLAEDGCTIFRVNGVCYQYDDSGFSESLKQVLKMYKETM